MPSAPASPLDLLSGLLSPDPDLSILSDPDAWSLIRKNANRHGVAPLIAYLARPHLQDSERPWCDRVLTRSWARHKQSLLDLDSVLEVLRAEGIQSLALKGPLLANRHYQPAFLRKPSGDIDLAVRNKDLEAACRALQRAGYSLSLPVAEARTRTHHVEMTHGSLPPIELHFRLSHGAYGLPVEEFFERAIPCQLANGRETWILSPADEILHLILHRAHGRFATLFHLYEIRRLWSAASPLVQMQVLQRATEYHFGGVLLMTDLAFRRHWNEPFFQPGSAIPVTWLQRRINAGIYERFERLSDPGRELALVARLGRRWIDFQLTDTPSDAARFARVLLRIARYQLLHAGWKTVRVNK